MEAENVKSLETAFSGHNIHEDEFFNSSPQNEKSFSHITFNSTEQFKKEDFEILGLLGKGAYAKVLKSKIKKSGHTVAIKTIDKYFIEKEKKLYQIYLEYEFLKMINHQSFIKIFGIFEEKSQIFTIIEYCPKGDFFEFIKINAPLPFETARFYTAQILLALEHLHSLGIAHRDLKPENIMLDDNLYIKIIDFATAKLLGKEFNKETMVFEELNHEKPNVQIEEEDDGYGNSNTNTFVGTAEYVSPEMLNDTIVGTEADLWALGCIIYQMFTGTTPFKDKTQYLIFKKIQTAKFNPDSNLPPDALDLVRSLLVIEPKNRLGSSKSDKFEGYQTIKNHSFFKGFDFGSLYNSPVPNVQNLKLKVFFEENQIKVNTSSSFMESPKRPKNMEVQVIKEGILKKKSPWFHYNKRKIVLYNSGKIEYLDPDNNQVKGVIYLTKKCSAVMDGHGRFDLITQKRTFVFQCEDNDSSVWVRAINDEIKMIE